MAIAVPSIRALPANPHSLLRLLARLFDSAPHGLPSVDPAIADLRLMLRRVEHAQREHTQWHDRYLARTIDTAVLAPLRSLVLSGESDRYRHGAAYALTPIAAIGTSRTRADVDIDAELAEAADHIRLALAATETRH